MTIFDLISAKGHKIARRRARKSDPEYAKREDARRVKPGVVLGSEGPGGLDGFFADIDFAHKFRPWWLKATLHTKWWLEKNGVRPRLKQRKWNKQRIERGFSDFDLWSFDSFLAKVIRDGVLELDRIKHGWPGEPMTFEEWGQILRDIADGMDAAIALQSLDYDYKDPSARDALEKRRVAGFDLFTKHFNSLWD